MRRDSTSYSKSHHDARSAKRSTRHLSLRFQRLVGLSFIDVLRLLAAMALGAALLALAYQVPVAHTVDIGGYDAAYVQGFFDPERDGPSESRAALASSDGSARWTRDVSYLLFPQAGLPAQVTLRVRGPLAGPAPEVVVRLNSTTELARFRAGPEWQAIAFPIDGGLLKPNDVVVAISSATTQLGDDPRQVGVLLDRATYRVGPGLITPYPAQLLYGALAAGMLYLLLVRPQPTTNDQHRSLLVVRRWSFAISVFVLCSLFLVLYRAQPPYPYPLRGLLPTVDGVLAALLALRHGPALVRRAPALLDGLALSGIGAWLAAVLIHTQAHVTLSVPGVEKDFRVFATRSAQLIGLFEARGGEAAGVLQADGFYNLGYPLLLWLARPFASDNPFLAGRLVAALSGALLLGATWWLARRLLGRGPALLALLMLALSPLVVEYALYLGSDMPFAALSTLALALLVATADHRPPTTDYQGERESGSAGERGNEDRSLSPSPLFPSSLSPKTSALVLAGLVAGMAFLVRHPGLLLLPLGWLAIWWSYELRHVGTTERTSQNSKLKTQNLLVFTLAFVIAIAPQVAVNLRDTGRPLYSQQAKNVWQAVFGNGDWGRWGEAADDTSLGQVIAQDPQRFLTNWWINLRSYIGTGGEDTSEFGRAVQLRLLGFPANWLAVAGLLGWLAVGFGYMRAGARESWSAGGPGNEDRPLTPSPPHPFTLSLFVVWVGLYVLAIGVGLALLPRFVLPLAPVYAIAAAWTVAMLEPTTEHRPPTTDRHVSRITHHVLRNIQLIAGILLLLFLWSGFATGATYVLRTKPADEAAVARAEQRAEAPGQPAAEVAAVRLVLATLQPGERLVVRTDPRVSLGKYSAIAHLAAPAPASDDPAALRSTGARYLLWDADLGPAPPAGPEIDKAGSFILYRIDP